MTRYSEESSCDLCGHESGRLHTGLGWFRDGGVKPLVRCEDHAACRRRVEDSGEEWPLESADEARRRVRTMA